MAHHWYSTRSAHRLYYDDSVPHISISDEALRQSVYRPMLHLYFSRIPPCIAVPRAVRLLSVSGLACHHLHGVYILDCLSIAGAWPRMPSPLVGTCLDDFSAPIYLSLIWSGQHLTIPISIHCQFATNTTAIVQVFISLAHCLVMERLEPWSSLHLGCTISGVHHRLLPPPPPFPPTISARFYPSSPAPPPVFLSSYVTRQRGVSDRPILSGVRRDKGLCGVKGEASYKLLCTLPCDASTVIAAGGPAPLPSHRFSFEQVSPLIIFRILWVICMGLKVMNQRYSWFHLFETYSSPCSRITKMEIDNKAFFFNAYNWQTQLVLNARDFVDRTKYLTKIGKCTIPDWLIFVCTKPTWSYYK